jgi:hypothetical protein
MYAPSVATPRSRFGGAKTVKPWFCSSDATEFQLDPSAHAPCTRTIVGFGMSVSPRSVSELGRLGSAYKWLVGGARRRTARLSPRAAYEPVCLSAEHVPAPVCGRRGRERCRDAASHRH